MLGEGFVAVWHDGNVSDRCTAGGRVYLHASWAWLQECLLALSLFQDYDRQVCV